VLERVRSSSNLFALGLAVLAVALATGVRYVLTPIVGPTAVPYVFYFATVTGVGLTRQFRRGAPCNDPVRVCRELVVYVAAVCVPLRRDQRHNS
jgi:hypothetical protein